MKISYPFWRGPNYFKLKAFFQAGAPGRPYSMPNIRLGLDRRSLVGAASLRRLPLHPDLAIKTHAKPASRARSSAG
jgi:hypothetical protein